MNFDNIDMYDYGHLGLVAGFIKQVGLIDYIDRIIPKTKPCYSELAIKTLNPQKITPKAINLGLTIFHFDGTAYNDNTLDDTDKFIRIVQEYSRDNRPELNQAILTLITENQAGIPIYLEELSGNPEDKSTFQNIIKSQLDSLKAAENSQYLIADSALYTKATIQSLHEKNRYFITRLHVCLQFQMMQKRSVTDLI